MAQRMSPKAQAAQRMSRADSLQSMSRYGKIVSPSQSANTSAPKPKKSFNPFAMLKKALGGKK